MGFNIGKINEVMVTTTDFVSDVKVHADAFKSNVQKLKGQVNSLVDNAKNGNVLPTLSSEAMSNKRWFGHTISEFKQIQAEIYSLGQLLTANYFVKFESYKADNLQSIPIFNEKIYTYLATETNIPLIQANFEVLQAGTVQINQFTGINLPELQINMLETADGIIANSLLAWLSKVINDDGTVNPPASYAGRITVGVFSKDFGLDSKPIERTYIVAPSASMIDSLNGAGVSEALQIPMTLVVLREFME